MATAQQLIDALLMIRKTLSELPPDIVGPTIIAKCEGLLQDLQDMSPQEELGIVYDIFLQLIQIIRFELRIQLGMHHPAVMQINEEIKRLH